MVARVARVVTGCGARSRRSRCRRRSWGGKKKSRAADYCRRRFPRSQQGRRSQGSRRCTRWCIVRPAAIIASRMREMESFVACTTIEQYNRRWRRAAFALAVLVLCSWRRPARLTRHEAHLWFKSCECVFVPWFGTRAHVVRVKPAPSLEELESGPLSVEDHAYRRKRRGWRRRRGWRWRW